MPTNNPFHPEPLAARHEAPSSWNRRRAPATTSGPLRRTPQRTLRVDNELLTVATGWEADAATLQRYGDVRVAEILRDCAARLRQVGGEFSEWLSEKDAAHRAGWTNDQLRRHARKYLHTEHVLSERGRFHLRACIVPRNAPPLRSSNGRSRAKEHKA